MKSYIIHPALKASCLKDWRQVLCITDIIQQIFTPAVQHTYMHNIKDATKD
jgi:hypothetical protein